MELKLLAGFLLFCSLYMTIALVLISAGIAEFKEEPDLRLVAGALCLFWACFFTTMMFVN